VNWAHHPTNALDHGVCSGAIAQVDRLQEFKISII
jgi:hypothetical protein